LLVMHPEVADVAVFSVPTRFGEQVKGVRRHSTCRAGRLRAELIAWCRALLTREMPKTSTSGGASCTDASKLYKRRLRDATAGHATRIL
jgi:hypothetical protein